jgi:hypothetical protein
VIGDRGQDQDQDLEIVDDHDMVIEMMMTITIKDLLKDDDRMMIDQIIVPRGKVTIVRIMIVIIGKAIESSTMIRFLAVFLYREVDRNRFLTI